MQLIFKTSYDTEFVCPFPLDQSYFPDSSATSHVLTKPKPETQDDLVARLANEISLEKKYKESMVDDIEQRLLKLKVGKEPLPSQNDPTTTTALDTTAGVKTEGEQVDEIIQRVS